MFYLFYLIQLIKLLIIPVIIGVTGATYINHGKSKVARYFQKLFWLD